MKVRPPLPPIPPLRIGAMAQGAPIGHSDIGAAMAQQWRSNGALAQAGGWIPTCRLPLFMRSLDESITSGRCLCARCCEGVRP